MKLFLFLRNINWLGLVALLLAIVAFVVAVFNPAAALSAIAIGAASISLAILSGDDR